jgi:hypothetical protein
MRHADMRAACAVCDVPVNLSQLGLVAVPTIPIAYSLRLLELVKSSEKCFENQLPIHRKWRLHGTSQRFNVVQ